MHVLGIKENQLEIRTVKSQAEKIPFSAYPLQLSTDFFFFFSLFSLRLPGLIVRLTPLYFSSCVSSFLSAGCGSSQASTSCLWNPATSLRGRSNRKWHREAVRWRWCVRGRPPPQQKGTTEAQISSFFFFSFFFQPSLTASSYIWQQVSSCLLYKDCGWTLKCLKSSLIPQLHGFKLLMGQTL